MELPSLAIAIAAAIVVAAVLSRMLERKTAARRRGAVAEVESTELEVIAAWSEIKLRRTAKLVKNCRAELGAKQRDTSHPLLVNARIDRELERVAAAEQKLVDADRMAAGVA